jgi:hypothetical protein
LEKYKKTKIEEVKDLKETNRGGKGFGSSGIGSIDEKETLDAKIRKNYKDYKININIWGRMTKRGDGVSVAYLIQPLYSFQPHVEIYDGSDRILSSFPLDHHHHPVEWSFPLFCHLFYYEISKHLKISFSFLLVISLFGYQS